MASHTTLNCFKCLKVFVSNPSTPLVQYLWACVKHTYGVCPECSKPYKHPLICIKPNCTSQTIAYANLCPDHFWAENNCVLKCCTHAWCSEIVDNPISCTKYNRKFCTIHECTHIYTTPYGPFRCPFQAIDGKNLCVACEQEKKFMIGFRFQLACQIGLFASNIIITRINVM